MPVRLRTILKDWFKRGKYPSENQFADWIDSFVHKTEDKLPIVMVEGLANQLNSKYDHGSGQSLERQSTALAEAVGKLGQELGQLSALSDFFHVVEEDDEGNFDLDGMTEPGYYFLVVYSGGEIVWHRILIVECSDWEDTASESERKLYSQVIFAPEGLMFRQGHYGYKESEDGDHVYSITWDAWQTIQDVLSTLSFELDTLKESHDILRTDFDSLPFYADVPDYSTTGLLPGVYVYSDGMDGVTVAAVSSCINPVVVSRPQGGSVVQKQMQVFNCMEFSSEGLRCRSGTVDIFGMTSDSEPRLIGWGEWQPVGGGGSGSGDAECFTDEEIEAIAMSVGGYVLPAEVVEPMTDPEIDDLAVKTGIADNT